MNRTALIAAIENENIELIKLVLDEGIQVKDALLHAISEEYVEAVETLLQYEEDIHEPGKPYVTTWKLVFVIEFSDEIFYFSFQRVGKLWTVPRQHSRQT